MAAKALRRGGVRLRSLGSGHTSLKLVISELSSLRQRLKDSTTAEMSVSQSLMKFGHNEENPALQDILFQMNELTELWTEAQAAYIGALKEYKRTYMHILESEKKLDQAKKHLGVCEDKERKYEKELLKGSKDPQLTKDKLQLARDNKELAIAEVSGQQKETEALKLTEIKAGLMDHSQAWLDLGTKCCIFAEAQRELALLVPECNPHTDDIPTYTGVRDSSAIIRHTRQRVSEAVPTYQPSRSFSDSPHVAPSSSKNRRPKSASYSYPSYSENYDSFDSFDEDDH